MTTKSVGTAARDFTTVTLLEADFNTFGAVEIIGEIFADSDFDESFDIADNTVTNWILRPGAGQGHDGTANSGVRFLSSAARTIVFSTSTTTGECHGLEFDNNGFGTTSVYVDVTGNVDVKVIFRNNLVHGNSVAGTSTLIRCNRNGSVTGNFVYDSTVTGSTTGNSILIDCTSGFTTLCAYNTCFDSKSTSSNASSEANGIQMLDDADHTCKNNISMDSDSTNGSNIDYRFPGSSNITSSNNMSEDATADDGGGANHKINQSTSGQFVSTTGGSQNFHLVSTSTAIGGGVAVSGDSAEIDINGYDRTSLTAGSFVEDMGAHQFLITAEIGTTSRDFTTMVLWQAALTGSAGSADSDLVGDMYKDSDFAESVTIVGGATVGANSATLKAATGEGHTGLANTGVRNLGAFTITLQGSTASPVDVIGLELDGNGGNPTADTLVKANNDGGSVQRLLVHGINANDSATGIAISSQRLHAFNCFVYGITSTHTGVKSATGIAGSNKSGFKTYNNTVLGVTNDNGSGAAVGISQTTAGDVQNNISMDTGGTTSGAKKDFNLSGGTDDFNLDSDGTSGGANSINNKASADQVISTTVGSENLHLLDTSVAIGAGKNLGTTPTGVNIDIDGTTRGATWDMGADENPLDTPEGVGVVALGSASIMRKPGWIGIGPR